MKRLELLIFIVIIFSLKEGRSQILFANPSFEGIVPPCIFCAPSSWIAPCVNYGQNYPPDIAPDTVNGYTILQPFNGLVYVGIVAAGWVPPPPQPFEPVSRYMQQHLNCSLKKGKEHSFTLYLAGDSMIDAIYEYQPGRVKIIGGTDSCSEEQILWESPLLTHQWKQYKAVFTPNENYSWVSIKPENMDDSSSADMVDLLSPITIANFNEVNVTVHDTTIAKDSCITLQAIVTAGYDSALWYKDDNVFAYGIGPYSDCPDSNAVYIVATRDTGCGQFWSYDTIRVSIAKEDTTHHGGSGTPPLIIPNFLTSETPLWQIINAQSSTSVTLYNTLGQLVYSRSEYKNNLNINELAAATYFYEVKYGSNTYRGKLMVIR